MKLKPLLLGFFILSIFPVSSYAITCYNDTQLNTTVCNLTANYTETNIRSSSIFSGYLSNLVESTKSFLLSFLGLQSNYEETNYNYELIGHLTPPPTYHIYITTDQILPGNTIIPLILETQNPNRAYKAWVKLYINNTLIFENNITASEGNTTINVPYFIDQETILNATAYVYSVYYDNTTTLQDTDSKLIQVVLSPFNMTIESPQNTTYTTNTIEVKIKTVTPNTNGIDYKLVLTIFNTSHSTLYNTTIDLSPSTISTITLNLTFSTSGTYTLQSNLTASINDNIIKTLSDSVTFTIAEQQTGGGGAVGGGGAGGGTTTTPPQQQVNATQPVVTEQPLPEQQPQGIQSTLPLQGRNLLIALIIAGIIIYLATRRR